MEHLIYVYELLPIDTSDTFEVNNSLRIVIYLLKSLIKFGKRIVFKDIEN